MTRPKADQARLANPGDIVALGSLMVEFYSEAQFSLAQAAAERTFKALVAEPSLGQVWLLESDGQAAGFVVLTVSFSMEYGGLRGFVDDFFVAKRFRRRGLGLLGLQAVGEECDRRRIRALLVETSSDNRDAVSVYRRAGFADTGHMLMKLELGPPVHGVEREE